MTTSHSDWGEMFRRQTEFQELIYGKPFSEMSQEELIAVSKDMVLHLHSECSEFMNEMAWKAKRRQSPHIIRGNLLEEAVDNIKMAMTLAIVHGFTAEEVMQAFMEKSDVVEQRYRQEFPMYEILRNAAPNSIVVLDIDGVLSKYPECFYDWVTEFYYIARRLKLGRADYTTLDVVKAFHGKLTVSAVAQVKDAYRQSGVKRTIPPVEGAAWFTEQLREMGFKIVLLTSRPYKKYSQLFADTMQWLNSCGICFDAILWAEDKELRLIEEFDPETVALFVDDNIQYVERVREAGFNAELMHTAHSPEGVTFEDILGELSWAEHRSS